jgi:succinate dehydrogenase / fumarate reductase, cytochrome b subunit
VKEKRPVNLDLTQIKFPVTAITSILHRVTGILLFVALPFLIWMLEQSISSESSFYDLLSCLDQPLIRFFSWVLAVAGGYHVLAGVRHILMDIGVIRITLRGGSISSWAVLVLAAAFAIFVGVQLW